MRGQFVNLPGSSGNMEFESLQPTNYQMHNAYEPRRMSRWLANFDDVAKAEKVTILPQSSLFKIPHMQRNPRQFLEIDLAKSCSISDETKEHIEADAAADTQRAKKWILAWGLKLRKVKKRQHLSNLRRNGHQPIAKRPPFSTSQHTNKSKVFRSLTARKVFAVKSIKTFKKLKIMQRLKRYKTMLEAPKMPPDMTPAMINLPDPATISTDLQTHCYDSLSNKHARSLLNVSARELLPKSHAVIWREAQRHFWRNNIFVIDIRHIKAVLSGFDARIKSYIGMLHVDLEALDDLDNLTRSSPSHLDEPSSQPLQAIRQQNQDLRRLM